MRDFIELSNSVNGDRRWINISAIADIEILYAGRNIVEENRVGLKITFIDGRAIYLQGEMADQLYDRVSGFAAPGKTTDSRKLQG